VSREIFRGEEKQTLSSNFVNFNSFLYYALKNAKGADVGIVIGDGLVVNWGSETRDVLMCIKYDTSAISSDYPIYDFAYR
jgi:hypothetical protein